MAKTKSKKSRIRELGDSKTALKKMIRFSATLLSPQRLTAKAVSGGGGWTFLTLPKQASAKLPSRSRVSVEGTINGTVFQATLEPDGNGGHWLKVDRKILLPLPLGEGRGEGMPIRPRRAPAAPGLKAGDVVTLEIAPVAPDKEPEPKVPADLRKALATAQQKARAVWSDITPIARRDWIHWIVSAKQAQARARRVRNACSMLAAGKRRPCCFDRSGMYGKSMSCPVAEDKSSS
jgi:hypothetical protein